MRKRQMYKISVIFLFGMMVCGIFIPFKPINASEQTQIQASLTGYALYPGKTTYTESENAIKCIIMDRSNQTLQIWINLTLSSAVNQTVAFQVEEYWSNNELFKRLFVIQDYHHSFFGELHAYASFSWLHLVFDGGNCQHNLDDVIPVGYPQLPLEFNPLQVMQHSSSEEMQSIPSIEEMRKFISKMQNDYLTIATFASDSGAPASAAPLTTSTNYGLIHECLNVNEESEYDDIVTEWETYTNINSGIHRYNPTRSQVLSDLHTFTRDLYHNLQLTDQRNLLAYEIIADGSSDNSAWKLWGNKYWDINEWKWNEFGTITPLNIESLWGSEDQGGGDVYYWRPTDCIVLAYSPYSWGATTTTNPDMGDVFVDYDAATFVGSITSISGTTTGDYSEDFWYELDVNNDDVEDATRALCTSGGWTYNSDWKILGDATSTF